MVISKKQSKNCVTFDKNINVSSHMAEYCHNSCSKCPPFARTDARGRPRHSSIALSMMVWSVPCQTCRKRCFSSQHLFRYKKLSYLRETARRFVSLNISLNHSKSFEMTLLSRYSALTSKNVVTLKSGLGSFEVIENGTVQ